MTATLDRTPSSMERQSEKVPMSQLLRRVGAADRTAFAVLYDAASGQVRGQAQAALSAGEAVDAVVAATFLQIWWLAPLYNPDESDAPAWISAIAAARIADRRRHTVPAPSADDADAQRRPPWSDLSGAHDETVAVVLAGLLGRHRWQKAF
ncbi:hypothetical protein [Allorhizocola rhizosphaerae]|uniref:hypothetical protein n=1 Tax=Allorhizocola rhizosphaerae TaxID=1872709 RepID=UPI0013C378BA|nr:hypothetical protein [Allorhizocola rhizosphaerae]